MAIADRHTPKDDDGAQALAPAGETVRAKFIEQSEVWIKRVADELPEEFLAAAMAAGGRDAAMPKGFGTGKDMDQIHGALMLRAVRAVDHMVRNMPSDLLVSAVAAPSDFGALTRALGDPRVAAPSHELDPLAGALGRSIAHRQRLGEMAGEMLSSAQVSAFLGIKRQAIDKRRAANRILAIRQGSDWLYPAFQFRDGDVVPGMDAVLAAHDGTDAWVIMDVLLAPDDTLGGRSLLDVLRAGDRALLERHLAQVTGDGYA